MLRMPDRLLPQIDKGRDKVLMDREERQCHAGPESVPLQLFQISRRLGFHTPMQNLDAFKANAGGVIDHLLHRHALRFEVPIRVSGDGQTNRAALGQQWRGGGKGKQCSSAHVQF